MSGTVIISAAALLLTLAGTALIALGARRIPRLTGRDVPPPAGDRPPVSIVVAARDEADTLEPALRSLLALDYPGLELIAVNDRSADATPQILDALAAEDRRLQIVHIDTLPAGWLGKTHALHQGAARASGDYLLFTDADVHMKPETLRYAVGAMQADNLDHLVALPRVVANGHLLRTLIMLTTVSLLVLFMPWQTRTRRNRFMGAGAFNFVRRAAYEACGGHRPLALAPVDDIELGRLIKQHGFTQGVAYGNGLIAVEWYPDVRSVVSGLEKNAFAVMDFRVWKLALASMAFVLMSLWPPAGLVFTEGAARWLNLVTVVTAAVFCAETAAAMGWSRRCVVTLPVATVILLYIWWRAVLLALWRGGIVWRGTFHSLAELKAAHRLKP